MTTGFRNASGVDFDSLFDPYVQGTSPAATGLRLSTGVDLAGRFAPITFGSKGPDVGFRTSGGVDVSNLWAAIGTAVYGLPIDGSSYSSSGSRGGSSLTLNMLSNGTYNVTRFQANNGGTSVLASGTWLPSGDSVSSYTCTYAYQLISSGAFGGGSNSTTNDAVTQSALTTSRAFQQASLAANTGQSADQQGKVTLKLYKSGVLRSTTIVTFTTSADGN